MKEDQLNDNRDMISGWIDDLNAGCFEGLPEDALALPQNEFEAWVNGAINALELVIKVALTD